MNSLAPVPAAWLPSTLATTSGDPRFSLQGRSFPDQRTQLRHTRGGGGTRAQAGGGEGARAVPAAALGAGVGREPGGGR